MIMELAIVLALILVNGAFVMGEMAIVAARRSRLKQMAGRGDRGARMALELGADQTRFLSTVQIGITVVGVLTGTFGGARLAEGLARGLSQWPEIEPYAHTLSIGAVVFGLSYASLVIGELLPKRIALDRPERIASRLSPLLRVVAIAARPAGWVLSLTTSVLLRLVPAHGEPRDAVTDDEIRFLMQEGTETGQFHEGERDIVGMALRLGDRRVSALMTPRTQMELLDLNDPIEENRQRILAGRFSRYPVIEGDVTKVIGILEVKDLTAPAMEGRPIDLRPEALKSLVRPALFIPDTAPALKALERFKRSGGQIALIVDEYGDLQGMVTLTDVLEALVGDITNPDQGEDPSAIQREDGSWLVDGLLPIDEVSDRVNLPPQPADDDYQTLGGFVMARLKRIPTVTDIIEVDGFRLEVVDMDGRRVDKVLITPPRVPPED